MEPDIGPGVDGLEMLHAPRGIGGDFADQRAAPFKMLALRRRQVHTLALHQAV